MSLQIGIVGLPNVGKSTLFRALTKKQVAVENFPFCTIDPNVGVVAVPDDRLQKLSDISHSAQIIPTTIEFVDIAGLVKGAHKGEGLGNQFLSHIRGVDAICHVLRDFHNDDIIHVEGKVDPESDRETIITELAMADLAVVLKRIDTLEAKSRTGDKDALKELELFQTLEHILNNSTPISSQPFTDDKQILLKPYNLLTLKPIIEVYNSDEQPVETPPLGVSDEDAPLGRLYNTRLTICAKLEAELSELDQEETRFKETLEKGVKFLLKYDDGAELRTIRPVTPYPGSPLYYYSIKNTNENDIAVELIIFLSLLECNFLP